ncbi:MAG TPA: sulfite exporter TauE/SafE family protein [Chitinophagaceae bacterium]|nr:sulfite exporter TauE/SafE family protein [Chitinophagaceae bacterium]
MLPIVMAGFTLGFAGSIHCIGMCGPLSMALPTAHLRTTGKIISLLLYQLGRIITYSLLGLVFGVVGKSIYLAGFQQWFSVTLGVLLLLLACLQLLKTGHLRISFLQPAYNRLSRMMNGILSHLRGPHAFLLLGMANGLLPCGLVYIALASTLAMPALKDSIAFMAMFGAGTLPAMMLLGFGLQSFKPGWRNNFRKIIPYFVAITGLVLLLRGLNLGIGFISPKLTGNGPVTIECHQ